MFRTGVADRLASPYWRATRPDCSAWIGWIGVSNGQVWPTARSLGSSRMRSTELQELPSISEFYPNYEATIWQGLFAPAGVQVH
jgi:hypothetical protein